jgi:hypothetical protein
MGTIGIFDYWEQLEFTLLEQLNQFLTYNKR